MVDGGVTTPGKNSGRCGRMVNWVYTGHADRAHKPLADWQQPWSRGGESGLSIDQGEGGVVVTHPQGRVWVRVPPLTPQTQREGL